MFSKARPYVWGKQGKRVVSTTCSTMCFRIVREGHKTLHNAKHCTTPKCACIQVTFRSFGESPAKHNPMQDWSLQEAVGETLEELWISYNQIEKLKGINVLKRLQVRYSHCSSNTKQRVVNGATSGTASAAEYSFPC